jgi:hypothetical protein
VAALKWNGWQHSSGIGGNFEPEYAPLSGFKAQCKVLGFKEGTQDFGNCVLELNEAK